MLINYNSLLRHMLENEGAFRRGPRSPCEIFDTSALPCAGKREEELAVLDRRPVTDRPFRGGGIAQLSPPNLRQLGPCRLQADLPKRFP